MRAFIDTNVIVDVVAKREPFFSDGCSRRRSSHHGRDRE